MTSSDNRHWQAIVPSQSDNTIVHFYVEATDGADPPNTAFGPRFGEESRALIKWDDSGGRDGLQSVRYTMLTNEANAMHAANDILSNYRTRFTLVIDEHKPIYDAGIRLRGSMFSRSNRSGSALNVKVPSNHRYRGVHGTITTRIANKREMLVKHLATVAGGIHDNYNDIVHQYGHISGQSGRARMEMTRFGKNYTDSLPNGLSGGTVFKMEGIREFQGTQNGSPESPKTPFPIGWISSFDIADQGDDKEIYRHNIRINTELARDNYSDMMAMCKAWNLSGSALEEAANATMNVDMWLRQFAMLSLCGIGDSYSQGNPHNLNFYSRPDGLVEPMPWDWDFTFNQGTSSGLIGGRNWRKIPSRPVFERAYYGHMKDMIESVYNREYMEDWAADFGAVARENLSGHLNYIRSRGNFVLGRLPDEIPFTITTNGGNAVSVDGSSITIEGRGWIDVRDIFVEGNDRPVRINWLNDEDWSITVPVNPGENEIKLTAIDLRGNEVGSDTISVTNTGGTAPASAENLRISELHYNPAAGLSTEFIELTNSSSTTTVDLSGSNFSRGLDFVFSGRCPAGTRRECSARGKYTKLCCHLRSRTQNPWQLCWGNKTQ